MVPFVSLIKHPSDRLNVLRGLISPVFFLLPFWLDLTLIEALVAAPLIYVIISHTNYILHLHIHHPFSSHAWLNRVLDLAMGSVTAMTASNWRIQHLHGHHRGDDRAFRGPDTSWELETYTPARALSYCLRTIVPTFVEPAVRCWRHGVLADERSPIRYRWGAVEHGLLFAFWIALAAWNLPLFLGYALPLYVLTHVITRYVDYLNHYGCDEGSPDTYQRANNSLSPTFNFLTHNFGYHTAHHLRPGAHWTTLPAIHAEIEDRIPARLKKDFSWSFVLMPYHVALSLRGRM